MPKIKVTLWRNDTFTNTVHIDPEGQEEYLCPEGIHIRLRRIASIQEDGDHTIAMLTDRGDWQSSKTGEMYSDLSLDAY